MRLVVGLDLAVVANAVALLIVAIVVDGVRIDVRSFAIAVMIFSLASLILRPILTRVGP